jgi:hypothetical protein
MTVRKLEKTQWRPYFDRVSEALIGKRAEIEVESSPSALRSRPSGCLCWASPIRRDLLEIELENLDHMIRAPQAVYIDDSPPVDEHEVVDRDGVQQIIRLRDLPMLPPPSAAAA